MSRYVEFGGGLGDCLNDIYRYDGFSGLQGKLPDERAIVGIISHNPAIPELFQHWPVGPRMEVHNYGYWQPEEDAGYRAANAMPPKPKDIPRPEWATFSFYNHPGDEDVLKELPNEYVAFSVSAGTKDRNFPESVLNKVWKATPFSSAFVGRRYERKGKEEHIPDAYPNRVLIDRLSLPATLNVIRDKRCKGVVCCHSAISILAGWEDKPQLLLYDEKTQSRHFQRKDQWSWHAFDRSNVFHGIFDQWRAKADKFFNHICSTVTV